MLNHRALHRDVFLHKKKKERIVCLYYWLDVGRASVLRILEERNSGKRAEFCLTHQYASDSVTFVQTLLHRRC